jgi:excinuclease ABC subunit A
MSDPDRLGRASILIRGARQNNLKNLDLDIPTGELVVVTGVSGSGKSSLVFDTLYAEGQRRYVETFSAYARQFLDRMDKPQVDRIEGVPPAIAIDQTNPVRTSRSTVGTMTELNDHLKLLFARCATLHCRGCARPVRRDTAASIMRALKERAAQAGDPRIVITFAVRVPANFTQDEVEAYLLAQGYARVHARQSLPDQSASQLIVVQDRLRVGSAEPSRLADAIEQALARGQGRVAAHVLDGEGLDAQVWRWSTQLHCAECDLAYSDPAPGHFSFNSPIGACEACRGFGRVIGVDMGLVIPDESKTLAQGAVKPWQTESFKQCQADLLKFARSAGVPLNIPYRDLSEAHRRWVAEGAEDWRGKWETQWYGVRHFFEWLESKAYKMHIRVLLSRYRSYTACGVCEGARLKPDSLLWRVGSRQLADATLGTYQRFRPAGVDWNTAAEERLEGLSIHDLMLLPLERVRSFFQDLELPGQAEEAAQVLLAEIRARLAYLHDVGLGYLTLDRQSRTLSGGEVQRINLTTALGTSLVNTLFVLDEPSIGLHPRDMDRIIDVMKRLRDGGNSLIVVEHDPAVMFAADRILDIGPGPGERGGEIVYFGQADSLHQAASLTADYLCGRKEVDAGQRLAVQQGTPRLLLTGACAHNLKNLSVQIPLGRLVALTGVSGSGKSTLMQGVLLPALLKARGKPAELAGHYEALLGHETLADVVFVDQSPIGKTTRSNPVSYVGAFDAIRKRFAQTEAAIERGYSASTFSFNSGQGRCPICGGNGFEHVEMQFLSDVYLRCSECDGRRYRGEVLEVRLSAAGRSLSIAQVLDLTVSEALAFFRDDREVRTRLSPLVDVGLDYLRLGQPVPTLSGGEAQRLKLAGFIAQAASRTMSEVSRAAQSAGRTGTLFMFDEPTTGLHFDDVAKLLRALRKLIAAGDSVLVIEHNLDLIGAADWVIELGPEGGDGGGELVADGAPEALREACTTHTGRALAQYHAQRLQGRLAGQAPEKESPAFEGFEPEASQSKVCEPADSGPALQTVLAQRSRHSIVVHRAREHNLKNIDVEVPRQKMTVISGVSGSGKSTLAFDVIFGEGQRRYLESLNAYARQFVQPASRPDVDGIFGIPPTVAIEQRTSRGGRKSTVATLTEIYHFLRLLYVKLGVQHCPDCGIAIEPQSFDAIVARLMKDYRGRHIGLLAPLVVARKGIYTDLAKWARGRGFSHLRVDGRFLPTERFPRIDRYIEHHIELPVADLIVEPDREQILRAGLRVALEHGKGTVLVADGLERLQGALQTDPQGATVPLQTRIFSTQRACGGCGRSFPEPDPRLFSFNSRMGWCPGCFGTGAKLEGFDAEQSGEEGRWLEPTEESQQAAAQPDAGEADCPLCAGRRLNRTALAVKLQGLSIAQLTALPVNGCAHWIEGLALSSRQAEIARDIVAEIRARLRFLSDVGLGYLALERSAPTLSGGEAQRIRLAAQLGSNLQGVCYVLDEPTIGLHPRDNQVLLDTLEQLKSRGNTLLVVEHDEDTIRRADHVIDIGPGAGRLGGQIIEVLATHPQSLTGRFLARPMPHPLEPRRPVQADTPSIELAGVNLHNLKGMDVAIALGRLTVITGVSGSGKSSLARDVLLANLTRQVTARNLRKTAPTLIGCAGLKGWEPVQRVLQVDQTPIGKTPRSCPATYVGFWDSIRKLFADTAEARVRGFAASRFSFNTGAGRCEACEGQGMQRIEMSFLPDVKVPCEACNGARFNRETLTVALRGKSIGEVLAMDVDEAVQFFAAHPSVLRPLTLLQEVGLGYLTLGQPSPTLSGGEAQRLKLVAELSRVRDATPHPRSAPAQTLYVLDEPDVEKLISVMHRLVQAGHTVVVVEHDVDLWAEADWIIDLGPGGGADGGQVVATGSPRALARQAGSATGAVLARFFARSEGPARTEGPHQAAHLPAS